MMNSIFLRKSADQLIRPEKHVLPGLLLLFWLVLPDLLRRMDATVGSIDQSIWLLVLMALICFLLLIVFCWWLLSRFWQTLGLPRLKYMVIHFKDLDLWQQLGFYFAAFSLLLLAGVGCLNAIC